jgi:hypothetical protein
MNKELQFEDEIEALVLEDAILFYNTGSITSTSRSRLQQYAEEHNRDFEEAQIMYNVLFPHAFHWAGEYNLQLNKEYQWTSNT